MLYIKYIYLFNIPLFQHVTLTSKYIECTKHGKMYKVDIMFFFLNFVTIYLIWNPKPDKDNTCTCTTIHFHEGDTPLCTAYRHVLASCTAYRLTTA